MYIVGTDRSFVHLSICHKKLYIGLGGGAKKIYQQKITHLEELGTKKGHMDEKWTDGQMAPASGDRLV